MMNWVRSLGSGWHTSTGLRFVVYDINPGCGYKSDKGVYAQLGATGPE